MNVGGMMIMIIDGSRLPIMPVIMAVIINTMAAMMMPIMPSMVVPTRKDRA